MFLLITSAGQVINNVNMQKNMLKKTEIIIGWPDVRSQDDYRLFKPQPQN